MEERGDNEAIRMVMVFPRKMNQCIRTYAMTYLKDTRIKPPYLLLIFQIGTNDGISQKQLNEDVPFDKSYISTMVRDLIDLGLVYNDSSGKVHSLRLTEQGKAMFAMSRMMFDLLDRNMFSVLTDEEMRSLEVIMGKLNDQADKFIHDLAHQGN